MLDFAIFVFKVKISKKRIYLDFAYDALNIKFMQEIEVN